MTIDQYTKGKCLGCGATAKTKAGYPVRYCGTDCYHSLGPGYTVNRSRFLRELFELSKKQEMGATV